MKRTRPTPLIGLGAIGIAIGFLIQYGAEAMGGALIVPSITLPLTLLAVAGIVIGFAIPIRRSVTGKSSSRIDPFRAMRVVVLARASSLVGALLAGASIGVLIYFTGRSVLPAVGSIWLAIACCVSAVGLVAAGLVAEYLCTLPKDDDDDAPGANVPS